MAELAAVDYQSATAEIDFVESLRDTGFGVLKNHPLDESTVSRIYEHWKAFFADEAKTSYLFDPERHDGFFPRAAAETAKGGDVRDIKEYFHFYPWGRCPPELKAELDAYHAETSRLRRHPPRLGREAHSARGGRARSASRCRG